MNDYIKKEIKTEFESVCNAYLSLLIKDWGYTNEGENVNTLGWWVADEVGGLYCFQDDLFISMDDIRYCVDNNVSEETYLEYIDYNIECSEYGFAGLNLKSFISGAPRINKEDFERKKKKKKEFEEQIERLKENLNNKSV